MHKYVACAKCNILLMFKLPVRAVATVRSRIRSHHFRSAFVVHILVLKQLPRFCV
jgi:hypothetical protein